MKVTRKGTVKLEKGEVRIGNFFVKDEDNHIKLQDLNGVFSHRVHKNMAIGIWLSNMLQGGQKDPAYLDSIKTYIGAMWSMFSVVPDNEFITDGIALANDLRFEEAEHLKQKIFQIFMGRLIFITY